MYGENYLFSIKGEKGQKNHNCDCVPYVQHGQDVCEVRGRLRGQEAKASRPWEESTWWERYVLSVRKEKIIKRREAEAKIHKMNHEKKANLES